MSLETSEFRPSRATSAMGRRPRQWRALSWGLVVAGVVGLVTAFLFMRRAEQARVQADFERWAQISANTLQRDLDRHLDFMRSIVALFISSREVDRQEFHRFNADALKRLPGVRALLWAPRITEAERPEHEARMRGAGWPEYEVFVVDGTTRQRAPQAPVYAPVLYIEPANALPDQVGANLLSQPTWAAAMQRALEQETPVATPLEEGGPVAVRAGDWGIFEDVFLNGEAHATLEERQVHLAGYVLGLLDLQQLVEASLQSVPELVEESVAVRLADSAQPEAPVYQSTTWTDRSARAREMQFQFSVGVGGRDWTLFCRPTAHYLTHGRGWEAELFLLAGLALVGLAGASMHRAASRAEWIERLVQQRTKELEQANRQLKAEIQERERTEQKLAREQYLVNALMDGIPDLVYFKNLESRFLRINKALAARFKLADPTEAVGRTDFDFFTPEHAQPALEDEQEVIRTGMPMVGREEKETWPDGSITWVSTTKQCLRDEQGRLIGTFGISRDITAHKLAEEALARKTDELLRSNRELEQFAYVASHDLQEPLRMVASYVQLLGRRYAGKIDADADQFITFAVDGAKRMQTLINDLLAYSRVSTRGKPFVVTDCNQVVQHALGNLQLAIKEAGAQIHLGQLPLVMADGLQLTQVFQNLIGNALKFRGERTPEIQVTAEQRIGPPREWLFAVRDNGIGIAREHFERIFVIFQRLHNREQFLGTGIGLAVCQKVVERHGGRIWVESKPGRGSTFFFTLPQDAPGETHGQTGPPPP